ncbi:MAG: squalene/phytoene synthase family protein [Anaerolineales bacterium]|nr:squalene/phytoene synthase family protein [Anaerolineales bacterium]
MNLQELLRISSRTFAIGIERLPQALSNAITIAYLLLRVSDYLEDNEEMDANEKIDLLNLWIKILRKEAPVEELTKHLSGANKDNPDALVAQQAQDIIMQLHALPLVLQEIIIHHVIKSTQGMARWTKTGPKVDNEADLDDYMFEVAGRVGYLVTQLFAWHSDEIRRKEKEIMPLAREFGLGLQTVNIIRGLREDFDRGWVYVPNNFLSEVGISSEQLFDPSCRLKALRVLDLLTNKAERHLKNALQYIKFLPWWEYGIRIGCILPLLFAIRTLSLSRNNAQVFESEAKMTREEVKKIVLHSTLWGWSNFWLDRYYNKLSATGE